MRLGRRRAVTARQIRHHSTLLCSNAGLGSRALLGGTTRRSDREVEGRIRRALVLLSTLAISSGARASLVFWALPENLGQRGRSRGLRKRPASQAFSETAMIPVRTASRLRLTGRGGKHAPRLWLAVRERDRPSCLRASGSPWRATRMVGRREPRWRLGRKTESLRSLERFINP